VIWHYSILGHMVDGELSVPSAPRVAGELALAEIPSPLAWTLVGQFWQSLARHGRGSPAMSAGDPRSKTSGRAAE
jgi:hypothetical protein